MNGSDEGVGHLLLVSSAMLWLTGGGERRWWTSGVMGFAEFYGGVK